MKKNLIFMLCGIIAVTAIIFSACELETAGQVRYVAIRSPWISVQPESMAILNSEYSSANPPELSIKIYDWNNADGSLSYQWFTFTDLNDFTDDKTETGGTPSGHGIPLDLEPVPITDDYRDADGDITISHPIHVTAHAGQRHYYYVEVINKNSKATWDREIRIRSEIVTVRFYAATESKPPVISKQPLGATYRFGATINTMQVKVAGDLDNLTYQWYLNEEYSSENGTEITGETESSFAPDYQYLTIDDNYFYVIVTNTEAGKTPTSEISVPAVITLTRGVRAAEPVITTQPSDSLYFTGDTIAPLSVTAESVDRGTLSYQWYSNTSFTARNGTRISSGGTDSTYTPPATTGNRYYYVVVTNTNVNVTGSKTATVTSKPVNIRVAEPGTLAENATITFNPATKYQYIRGYGGMDVAWANFPEQLPGDMETMYNPDWGLGYNINRIMVSPASTNIDTMMEWLTKGRAGVTSTYGGHRPNYYENVKIVNKYNGYNLASPWSPPKDWKSNNSINGGGYLLHQYYPLFANYLRAFAQHMLDKGAPIYAISISNEPNYTAGYDGCEWEPDEMRNFHRQAGIFTRGVQGYGGGQVTQRVLIVSGESANTPTINLPTLQDEQAKAAVDFLCRHIYGSQTVSLWNSNGNLLDKGLPLNQGRMEVWMTEHNINSANATAYPNDSTWNYVWRFMNDVDLVIRMNNENAFVWWASKRFYSMLGDGQFGTVDGVPTPRGYGLSHYAKYSIDTNRIAFTIDGTTGGGAAISLGSNVNNNSFNLDNVSVRVTAFESLDGNELSVVLMTPTNTSGQNGVNMGTVKLQMPTGFKIGSVRAQRSNSTTNSARTNMQFEDVTISQERDAAWVTLPASNLLSVKFTRQAAE
jgi:O-glycosyl hydrolase